MAKQTDLIGDHPSPPNQFGIWLKVTDHPVTLTKCHRALEKSISSNDNDLLDWFARKIIDHHYTDFRLNRLKQKYKELGFEKYAAQNRKLPNVSKQKKGNGTEILLTEYIQSTLNKKLIKVFKLKYNPNVDQSIKGDDTLMVELFEKDGIESIRIYLGESKFRSAPRKQDIDNISASLEKSKMPLSYSFLVEEMAKQDEALAIKLDQFIVTDIKNKGDLIYTGLLLSNTNSSNQVEKHLNNDNPQLIFVSIGIEKPEEFINKAFDKAELLISDPSKL